MIPVRFMTSMLFLAHSGLLHQVTLIDADINDPPHVPDLFVYQATATLETTSLIQLCPFRINLHPACV